MKRYALSFADSLSHVPEHPERTARKSGTGMNFDVQYQVWTNRPAMLKSIEIQDRHLELGRSGWKACSIEQSTRWTPETARQRVGGTFGS